MELNHRPHAYQACALTKLSYRPRGDFEFQIDVFTLLQKSKIQNPFEPIFTY